MAYIIFLVLFVAMWIVLIVPRQRELRRHQALMGRLDVGDDVMMGAGLYGTIRSIDDDYVMLEVADGVHVKIAKRSIAAKVEPTADDPATDADGVASDETAATQPSDSTGA